MPQQTPPPHLQKPSKKKDSENTLQPDMMTRLMHNLPGMAYRCNNDADWTMLFVSQGCEALTGYHPLELLHNGSKSYESLIHPEDQQLVREAVEKGVAEHQQFRVQYRIRNKAGAIVHVWEQGNAIYDAAGSVICLDGLITDITQRVKLERAIKEENMKMEERNREKDTIFSIIAHDLQNPVYAIISNGEYVLREHKKMRDKDFLDFISQITVSARDMLQLLDNLVDWSRLKSGMLKHQRENFKLTALIRECVDALRNQAMAKEISIDVKIPGSLVLNADRKMLSTMTRNIISNAIKYSHPRASIEVSATSEKNATHLRISDHGIGMSRTDSRKVFDIHKRIKRPGTAQEAGSGMGLALCAEFAKIMGITIDLESKINHGTTITLLIPDHTL